MYAIRNMNTFKYFLKVRPEKDRERIKRKFKNNELSNELYEIIKITDKEFHEILKLQQEYYNRKYGIWNSVANEFQFSIVANTKKQAERELFNEIGNDARKYRFSIREISKEQIEKMKERTKRKNENVKEYYKALKPLKVKRKRRIAIEKTRQKEIGAKFRQRGHKCHFKTLSKVLGDEKVEYTIGTLEGEYLFKIQFEKCSCDEPGYSDEIPRELQMTAPHKYESWRNFK